MSTTFQKIVAEAKKIRKLHPNKHSKWTDYVKEASKKIKPTKAAKKVAGFKKGRTHFIEVGEKKKRGKNIRVVRRTTSGKKGSFRDFVTISGVMSVGKNLLMEKLGKLESTKFATPLKRDKNKIQKQITEVKKQLRKFLK